MRTLLAIASSAAILIAVVLATAFLSLVLLLEGCAGRPATAHIRVPPIYTQHPRPKGPVWP